MPHHAVVDHRPRALEISGFAETDRVDLLPHFAVSRQETITEKRCDQCDLLMETVGGRSGDSVKGHCLLNS